MLRVPAFARSIGLNTVAFALIIGVQQLVLFPALSRMIGAEGFASTILFVTFSTLVVNVVAGEASNVSLLRSRTYSLRALPWDSFRLVILGIVSLIVIVMGVLLVSDLHEGVLLQYAAVTCMGMIRTYLVAPDKALDKFGRVVIVHFFYAIGGIIGLFLVEALAAPLIVFVCAELAAICAVIIVRLRHQSVKYTVRRTPIYFGTRRKFSQLAFISFLSNLAAFLDRIIIAPLLGASSLGTYYAATALSKGLALVINPGANAMLSKLGASDDSSGRKILRVSTRITLYLWWGLVIASALLSYGGLRLLYPDYLELGSFLVVPAAISAASVSSSAILKPAILRFVQTSRVVYFNMAYFVVFFLGTLIFSAIAGLAGFAWAVALANSSLFLLYLIQSLLLTKSDGKP